MMSKTVLVRRELGQGRVVMNGIGLHTTPLFGRRQGRATDTPPY